MKSTELSKLLRRVLLILVTDIVGVVLNLIVICVNNGMPVPYGTADINPMMLTTVLTLQTRFSFLADVIPVGFGYCSIGDVLIAVSIVMWCWIVGKFVITLWSSCTRWYWCTNEH